MDNGVPEFWSDRPQSITYFPFERFIPQAPTDLYVVKRVYFKYSVKNQRNWHWHLFLTCLQLMHSI